tara:strand:+ start:4927 stop:5247 length:321 start_codon:yes stop_codon:yes gene_type:complete
MSERWNNQTQDWEVVEETLAETLKEQVVESPPVETVVESPPVETVVESPPVVDTLKEFGKESIKNVELVEMPIEVVNAKPSHFGFEAWHGVLGIIVLVVAWRWLKK